MSRCVALGLALLGFGLATSAPVSAAVPHPAPIGPRAAVPLGAAVWYGCTDAVYAGPAPLRCLVPGFDARYASTFTQSFDRLTPENEFKMLWTQPAPGRFDFSVADKIVAFAEKNAKQIRGHTLVYAAANPGWVENPFPAPQWTRESLLEVMRTHIATMVGRYKGSVHEWDVVNEPFTDSGAREPNVYERVIGSDWVEQAFRAANAADPEALLFLNEFNADVAGPRQQAVLALVTDFVRRGVPIDGVGLQMHVGSDGTYPTVAQLKEVMADYAALGLRVEPTETDVLHPRGPGLDAGLVQRAAYDTVARACQESPNCTGMSVWGVADAYSWRSAAQTATLFSANFTRKRAYDLVRCRLADLKPATGAWAPRNDCGAIGLTPPATTTPAGLTGGSSAGSDPGPPPVPKGLASLPPAVAPSLPLLPPRAPSDAPPATLRVTRPRPTLTQLRRGITARISGARPGTAVRLRIRRAGALIASRTRRARADGTATITARLPLSVRRAVKRRARLTVTGSFLDTAGRRSVKRFAVTVR